MLWQKNLEGEKNMRTKMGKNKMPMMLISITIAALFIGTSMSSALANDSIGANESNEKTRDEVGLVPPSNEEAPSISSERSNDAETALPSLADSERCLFWVGEPYNIWVNGTIIDGECVPDWLPDVLPIGVPEDEIKCSICGGSSNAPATAPVVAAPIASTQTFAR